MFYIILYVSSCVCLLSAACFVLIVRQFYLLFYSLLASEDAVVVTTFTKSITWTISSIYRDINQQIIRSTTNDEPIALESVPNAPTKSTVPIAFVSCKLQRIYLISSVIVPNYQNQCQLHAQTLTSVHSYQPLPTYS